jgi:hypothetical protein
MDSDLDSMMERAKRRVLTRGSELTPRGEQSFNPEYIEQPFAFFPKQLTVADYLEMKRKFKSPRDLTHIFISLHDYYAWRGALRKAGTRKHKRPGRKRGRKY